MATLSLKHINKVYENNEQAVTDFNLDIMDKEFIVLVGPSGCGKSTTLRMIAGLEDITSGELYIDDVLMNDVAPKNRNIAMVFQSYALYPHMSVYENMAFGLKAKKLSKNEIDRRIKEAAQILEIEPYLNRKPKALSGGQKQRVALGRAIVRNAQVFLMDEPLSNLDAKLRVQMRSEIIKLHEKINATTIYVTHDQTEAMTMATRIVVMKEGRIQQIGTPMDVYTHPINMFVAGFLGALATNFLSVVIQEENVILGSKSFPIPEKYRSCLTAYQNKNVIMGIRPEDITLDDTIKDKNATVHFDYHVEVSELLGAEWILHGQIEGQALIVKATVNDDLKHRIIAIHFDLDKLHFFDPTTQIRIDEASTF